MKIIFYHNVGFRKTLEIHNKFSVILHLIKGLLLLYFENSKPINKGISDVSKVSRI